MRKTLIFVILFSAICFTAAACSPGSPAPSATPTDTAVPVVAAPSTKTPQPSDVEVIYYDNSGFLVRIEEKKILIDTLFDSFPGHSPPSDAFTLMLNGEPPFDDVDLVLTTHTHTDHFSAEVTSDFLSNNPGAVFLSTFQVVEQLVAENPDLQNPIYSVDLQAGESEVITLDGIEVECLYISHNDPNLLNLGFVVRVGEVTFFNTGDIVVEDVSVADLVAYGLPERDLDFVLIPYIIPRNENYHEYLTEGIQAKYILPTHYHYNEQLSPFDAFPEAIIFSDTLQSWQMP